MQDVKSSSEYWKKIAKNLIRRFVTFHSLHRPYITLKWAESADKHIDKCRKDGKPVILSTPLTSMLVHKDGQNIARSWWAHTAELDNPSLTVRSWQGQSPVRIVIDRQQHLSPSLHLFDDSIRTLVFTGQPMQHSLTLNTSLLTFNKIYCPKSCNICMRKDCNHYS